MELIREIGSRRDERGKRRKWGVFKCSICGKEVERILTVGQVNSTCSQDCGFEYKSRVIQQKKAVQDQERPKTKGYSEYSVSNMPDECKGCGYWTGKDGCNFIFINGYSRTGHLKGRTCREAGIYTTKKQRGNSKINY